MKKENILLVHNYYQQSGGEDAVVENEKRMLEKNGHLVYKYTRTNDELNTLRGKLRFLFSFLYSKKSLKEIKTLIKEKKIDIVHVHNTFPLITASVYVAAKTMNIPVVQTLHNFRFVCPGALYMRDEKICEDCNRNGLQNAIKHKCYRNSKIQTAIAVWTQYHYRKKKYYDMVDAYISLTDFNKKKFEEAFPWCHEKIYTKPNFTFDAFEIKCEKSELCNLNYIYVGRLSKEKGIEVLLRAFEKMPLQNLDVIGSGPLRSTIEGYISKHQMKNVHLYGQLTHDNTIKKMMNSKVLILPSTCYESFGMTIIEAFSCGIPAIGSRLGNIQEIISDRENGLLFSPGDENDLIKKIQFLEKNIQMYEKMSRGARSTFFKYYTEEENYYLLHEIYDIVSK